MFTYSDITWIFDQSERAQGPIYIMICSKLQYVQQIKTQ